MNRNCAVILAAGEGKRMKSKKPKVLCEILFRPMLDWVLSAVEEAGVENACVITGHKREQVEEHLGGRYRTAVQDDKGYGTGYAVQQAAGFLRENAGGSVLILCGDAPMIDAATIRGALELHEREGNSVTVITARIANPAGYGRIVRTADGALSAIVEQNDADEAALRINEVNSGAYWFRTDDLLSVLFEIGNGNEKGEYYLTDAVGLLVRRGLRAGAFTAATEEVIYGANDKVQMQELNERMRRRILERWMRAGVDIPCADGVMIGGEVSLGADTVILPGTVLRGKVVIGEDCEIGPNTLVENSTVGNGVKLNNVQCYQSVIEDHAKLGPFVHIRPNSHLCEEVYLGDFVEVKNSTLGKGAHASHLTYIGDSDVGEKVNFGCGTVTVNYNGMTKARCTIGNNAFIGCNTNLVAPVKIGDFGYTAAGSTITEDVPDYTLAISRVKGQVNKVNYVKEKNMIKKK